MKKQAGKKQPNPSERAFDTEELRIENAIGLRIADARKALGISASDLGRSLSEYGIHVQRGAVSKWELGISVPNGYQLLAICSVLGIHDALSYFSGKEALNTEGLKKLGAYREDLLASGLYCSETNQLPARNDSSVPAVSRDSEKHSSLANSSVQPEVIRIEEILSERRMIPVKLSLMRTSAGTGCFLDEEYFETVMMPEDDVPIGTDFAVTVSGNSMEPRFHDGETVFVRQCSSLRPGEIGLFILDGQGYIKKYSEQTPDVDDEYSSDDSLQLFEMRPQPVLISLNPDYSPIAVLPGSELQIVGKILCNP